MDNKNVFIDTKRKLGEWIENADYIKINSLEYEQNEDFFKIYDHVFKKTIVTKGNEGCLFEDKLYPTDDVQVKDISGAGDTFLAGLVVRYLETENIIKSIATIRIANKPAQAIHLYFFIQLDIKVAAVAINIMDKTNPKTNR